MTDELPNRLKSWDELRYEDAMKDKARAWYLNGNESNKGLIEQLADNMGLKVILNTITPSHIIYVLDRDKYVLRAIEI